jgi:hypothetical protein
VKPRHPYSAVAMWCVVFFALVPSMCAQEAAAPKHTGVPQDWSQRHIVFSRDALARHPELIYREPRILHQAMQRWQAPNFGVFRGADSLPIPVNKSGIQRDWNVKDVGGRLSAHMFPAKFSFDPSAPPDCTNDYVVFGLATAGVTGGQANLVAFNNLYVDTAGTGFCTGIKAPTVKFAYNITTAAGGRISTSPILSLDGTKIAFVESAGLSSIFHVLTWTARQGALKDAAAPTMTSLTFSTTENSTTSSPWIDYGLDIVYVGADKGKVYKITGVFNGTPTLAGSPWPVAVGALDLTSPVLDSGLGVLMVGSANGNLYQIDLNSPSLAFTTLPVGAGTSHGILAAPIVDVTNGTTFVVSANDGTSAVLEEVDTAPMTLLSKARIGWGSASGTTVNLYEPAFSNDYFANPSNGVVSLCGTGPSDTYPWQYVFGFTGATMSTSPYIGFPLQLSSSTASQCTGWTEFFNPNVGTGTDFFFFGLTQNCNGTTGGLADGCVVAISTNGGTASGPYTQTGTTTATVDGGPSGIVVDNYACTAPTTQCTSTVYPQASSIYLSAEDVNTLYKFTQNGLQ